jgi:hypothetical protein
LRYLGRLIEAMRLIKTLLLLVAVVVPVRVVFGEPVMSAESVEKIRPLILKLSDIKQGTEPAEDFIKHPFELEEPHLPSGIHALPLTFTPQHVAHADVQPLFSSVIAAPALLASFAGIPAPSHTQPDCIITAGPTRVMVAVNSSVAIFTKTGQRRFQTSFFNWFASLKIDTTNLFDPRLLYDQYTGHFIFICDARRGDGKSWYLFSVSKTSNPEGDWAFWALDMTLNSTERVNLWADFPRIGVDHDAIYLTGNMTDFFTFAYKYAKLRVLKKSEVYAFGNIGWHDFWNLKDASGALAFDITPAHSFGKALAERMVSTDLESGNTLTLWTVTDGGTDHPVVTPVSVPVSSYSIAPPAVQKGGGNATNVGTPNPVNVVYRNGSVFTAIDTSYNWGSGDVSAIRYYRISKDGALQDEVTFGADGFYYFFPAVIPDARGNVYLVFNRSSVTQFIGIYYAGRKPTDPPGKFSKSTRLQSGLANYENAYVGSSLNRWGDYNGIARDPGGSIWIYSQFPKSSADYATTIGRINYPK